MASASQGVTNVNSVSYPQKAEITLKLCFEVQSKDDQDYLQIAPDYSTQFGFIADLFEVWNDNALPILIEINGFTKEQIKQRMLGTIL